MRLKAPCALSASGSRRAAIAAGRDPLTCRQTVMDRGHRFRPVRAATRRFLQRFTVLNTAEFRRETPNADLARRRARTNPGNPARDEQRALQLPSGVSVTRNLHTGHAGNQPVEVLDTISNGEAVSYRCEIEV